jgi:hypothetical protein
MSNHVTEWLNVYFDGELTGKRLFQVEEHLAECEACQVELESLEKLSGLLHKAPVPEFTSSERFAAQISLRIPHKQVKVSRNQIIDVGWWMVPVGLLTSWIFISTAFVLNDVLSAASNFGVLSGISEWLGSGISNSVYLSTSIGQTGLLSGTGLNWAEAAETFTRASFSQIILQASIALLYLSWLAIWWAHHQHQGRSQFLES